MVKASAWVVSIAIISACTCGARTECNTGRVHIAFLTTIHNDSACRQLSPKGVLLYEAANYIADAHNEKSKGTKINIIIQDTCGSIAGSLKAAMKALVMADVNCVQPPNFLGIIGPDSIINAEAIHKVTSLIKVPLIVRKTNNALYMHYLSKESDNYIVKGLLKLLETLKWKSFTLVANSDENNEDDVQNILKKFTMEAIAKNMCAIIHNKDNDEYSSHIVHIGNPSETFFSEPNNASIIIVSGGNFENNLNKIDSSNNILQLGDSRNDFAGLKEKVEKSKWWSGNEGVRNFDAEKLREVRWLKDAIESYLKALDTICRKKKCKNQLNAADWNNVLANVLESHNAQALTSKTLEISMKTKGSSLQEMGRIIIHKNLARMYWAEQSLRENDEDLDEDEINEDNVPEKFKKFVSKDKSTGTGCVTSTKGLRVLDDDDDKQTAPILVTEIDDNEWWTMVATVSGVGVAMFVIGILAVYVVIANIRGPRPKSSNGRFERNNSLRRVGSDREIPSNIRNPARSSPQRKDSIRSTFSEKSV